nr:ribonuclease H-like domain-containing protein [Tanacetum cinerariifolium]
GIPQDNIDDKGYWDNGCSRHLTRNISYLSDYDPFNGGYVSFGHERGKISGEGLIKTSKLEFENVYFVEELKYNLFSVSQIYDNKNSVLFTYIECLVLGKDFKLVDDKHVLHRTHRQQNMYTIDLKNINGVAERRNRTLIEAARTMLADAKLPASLMLSSKAFRVFNKRTKKIEENLHVDFLKNRSIKKGIGPDWLFDIDTLTSSMNYVPVVFNEAQMETSNDAAKKDDTIPDNNALQKEQEEVNGDKEIPKSSGNINPTASIKFFTNDSVNLIISIT